MARLKTVIGFRVDEGLREDLLKAASEMEVSVSEFCRQITEDSINTIDLVKYLRSKNNNKSYNLKN